MMVRAHWGGSGLGVMVRAPGKHSLLPGGVLRKAFGARMFAARVHARVDFAGQRRGLLAEDLKCVGAASGGRLGTNCRWHGRDASP